MYISDDSIPFTVYYCSISITFKYTETRMTNLFHEVLGENVWTSSDFRILTIWTIEGFIFLLIYLNMVVTFLEITYR